MDEEKINKIKKDIEEIKQLFNSLSISSSDFQMQQQLDEIKNNIDNLSDSMENKINDNR